MKTTTARPPLIGSLCSGYGGLDLGVKAALGGTLAWHAEINPDAARILARHWPGVPNLQDITTVNWANVPRVCVLTASFPCQRRLRRWPPGRTQPPHLLGAVAARRPCGRSPRGVDARTGPWLGDRHSGTRSTGSAHRARQRRGPPTGSSTERCSC
ncbi:DNA cytosine methyltransferase [Streptomyces nodosus]|uniref:DNA cytosine methyltransferase n=1 Tax=Streptomyces nodosus TaxID=40318 RepID=UPI0036E5EF74